MENIKEKYLPIGTVVMLKNGKKRVMITGFCCVDNDDTSKMYDYCACLYPEGTVSSDKNMMFDHNQIEKVYAEGYSDDEEKLFKEKLQAALTAAGLKKEN